MFNSIRNTKLLSLHWYNTAVFHCILNLVIPWMQVITIPVGAYSFNVTLSGKLINSIYWMFSPYHISINNMSSLLNTWVLLLFEIVKTSSNSLSSQCFSNQSYGYQNSKCYTCSMSANFRVLSFIFSWRMSEKWTPSVAVIRLYATVTILEVASILKHPVADCVAWIKIYCG